MAQEKPSDLTDLAQKLEQAAQTLRNQARELNKKEEQAKVEEEQAQFDYLFEAGGLFALGLFPHNFEWNYHLAGSPLRGKAIDSATQDACEKMYWELVDSNVETNLKVSKRMGEIFGGKGFYINGTEDCFIIRLRGLEEQWDFILRHRIKVQFMPDHLKDIHAATLTEAAKLTEKALEEAAKLNEKAATLEEVAKLAGYDLTA